MVIKGFEIDMDFLPGGDKACLSSFGLILGQANLGSH